MHAPLASHCTLAESDVTSRLHPELGMIDRRNGLTYADSGVDIDAGNRLVDLIKPMVRATAGADAKIKRAVAAAQEREQRRALLGGGGSGSQSPSACNR